MQPTIPESIRREWYEFLDAWGDPENLYDQNALRARNLPEIYPQLLSEVPLSPCRCGFKSTPLYSMIIHLNDTHHWDRDKIADWIDTL